MNRRLITAIDRKSTVIQSYIYRIIDVVISRTDTLIKGIGGRYIRFRFQVRKDRGDRFQSLESRVNSITDSQDFQACHKSSKLVTSIVVLSRCIYADPVADIGKTERRMDTPPHPRDLRKPPLQDAEHFSVRKGKTQYGQDFFVVGSVPRDEEIFRCPCCGVEIPRKDQL